MMGTSKKTNDPAERDANLRAWAFAVNKMNKQTALSHA